MLAKGLKALELTRNNIGNQGLLMPGYLANDWKAWEPFEKH
jgi:hypothetical protein